jgi:hypothetical protein
LALVLLSCRALNVLLPETRDKVASIVQAVVREALIVLVEVRAARIVLLQVMALKLQIVSALVLPINEGMIKKLIKKRYKIKYGKHRQNCLVEREEVRA